MENFTPRAQRVLHLARKEAEQFNHNYVGTEHLLLGLLHDKFDIAGQVLNDAGLTLEAVRGHEQDAVAEVHADDRHAATVLAARLLGTDGVDDRLTVGLLCLLGHGARCLSLVGTVVGTGAGALGGAPCQVESLRSDG